MSSLGNSREKIVKKKLALTSQEYIRRFIIYAIVENSGINIERTNHNRLMKKGNHEKPTGRRAQGEPLRRWKDHCTSQETMFLLDSLNFIRKAVCVFFAEMQQNIHIWNLQSIIVFVQSS